MYQRYWQLKRTPFASHGIRDFQSEIQTEAIARIEFLANSHRRVGLLVGPEGVGKSAVLEHVKAVHRRCGQPAALMNVLGMDGEEFLLSLCGGLGISFDEATAMVAWRALFDQFQTNQYQNQHTLIVVDDVHDAESEVLTMLARIAQWQPGSVSGVTVVCGCRADRTALVGNRLLELADLRMELTAWEVEDTAEFIRSELRYAGCERTVFEHEAICAIHAANSGVARGICRLAELALIAGAGQGLDRINADFIECVQKELSPTGRLVPNSAS